MPALLDHSVIKYMSMTCTQRVQCMLLAKPETVDF